MTTVITVNTMPGPTAFFGSYTHSNFLQQDISSQKNHVFPRFHHSRPRKSPFHGRQIYGQGWSSSTPNFRISPSLLWNDCTSKQRRYQGKGPLPPSLHQENHSQETQAIHPATVALILPPSWATCPCWITQKAAKEEIQSRAHYQYWKGRPPLRYLSAYPGNARCSLRLPQYTQLLILNAPPSACYYSLLHMAHKNTWSLSSSTYKQPSSTTHCNPLLVAIQACT